MSSFLFPFRNLNIYQKRYDIVRSFLCKLHSSQIRMKAQRKNKSVYTKLTIHTHLHDAKETHIHSCHSLLYSFRLRILYHYRSEQTNNRLANISKEKHIHVRIEFIWRFQCTFYFYYTWIIHDVLSRR